MRVLQTVAGIAAAGALAMGCQGGTGDVALNSFADSASYAIGMNMGQSIVEVRDQIDLDLIQRGMADVVEGRLATLSDNDAVAVLQVFAQQVRESQQLQMADQSQSNRQAGVAFMEQNGRREGVVTTASGMQYEVLQIGSGPKPTASDRVQVHYTGTLVDGQQFESSVGGDPVTFGVTEVIPGWTEALQLMSVGAKYRIVLPPNLAYGEGGGPGGPGSTLIFEVELLDIVSQ
jgi:FKBP-type peptidyl-prolyl cis-trans isomerase